VLDEVRPEAQHLVQGRARHRAEAVSGQLLRGEAEATQGGIDRVFRYGSAPGAYGREHKLAGAGQEMQIAQDGHRLRRRRHDMRHPGLAHGVAPFRGI